MCRSKHVEQLRNIGIINSTTRSHLVGYFYKIYIMMHGSMNIKYCKCWRCLHETWYSACVREEGHEIEIKQRWVNAKTYIRLEIHFQAPSDIPGYAIAQAVIRRHLTAEARVWFRSCWCGLCVGTMWHWERFRLSSVTRITPVLHTVIHSCLRRHIIITNDSIILV